MPPASTELEQKIVTGLLTDLNNIFDLGLDTKPDFTWQEPSTRASKPKILVIGGSHAGRTGDELEERGYDVIRVCTPGWRPTKAADGQEPEEKWRITAASVKEDQDRAEAVLDRGP